MNKKKIESLEPLISNIDTYPVSVEHLKVERALNFKERRALKKKTCIRKRMDGSFVAAHMC